VAKTVNAKLIAALKKIQDHHDRGGVLIAELTAIINAEETPGQQAKRLLDFFCRHWERMFPREKYVVNGAKDMASLKRLLKTLEAEEIAARIRLYFQSTDKFIVESRWSLPVFIVTINRLVAAPTDDSLAREVERTARESRALRSTTNG
jgi:hypothetical protein